MNSRGGYILTLIFGIIAGYLLASQCNGGKPNTALIAARDSLHTFQKLLEAKDSENDDLHRQLTDAGFATLQAAKTEDSLKDALRKSQEYADGLAKDHWYYRDKKDTGRYILNCDAMARELTISRDSVHNLQAQVNAFVWGADEFRTAYFTEHSLADSLNRELLSIKNAYRALAAKAIEQVDTVTAAILHQKYKPKLFAGATVVFPFGAGPSIGIVSGNTIFSGAYLVGTGKPMYQLDIKWRISFKKPHFSL